MVDFDNVLCDAYDLHDKDLMRLRDEISKEIQKREKQREIEAAEKVVKAIQDYLAAGYTLWVKGSALCDDHGFTTEKDIETEVFEVINKNGEVTISIMECDLI